MPLATACDRKSSETAGTTLAGILSFVVLALLHMGFAGFSHAEYIFSEEIRLLEEQLPSKPNDPDLLFELGKNHYLLGRFWEKRSEEVFRDEEKKLEDSEEAIVQYHKSIAYFKECISIQPSNMSAHFNLALNYYVKEEGELAIVHMRRAQQLFLLANDLRGAAKSRKALRKWYDLFGYRPQDFDSPYAGLAFLTRGKSYRNGFSPAKGVRTKVGRSMPSWLLDPNF